MGLFSTVKAPTWQGATTAPTTQSRFNLADLWKPYDPKLVQSSYDPNAPNRYSGAEGGAIAALNSILQYGGYSPEQKQTMLAGSMAPVYEQANEAARRAQADAYARGLGQSGVLSRSYGDINKGVETSIAQLAGQIEQAGQAQVLPAIGAVQTGQKNLADMLQSQSQFNANLALEREKLATQMNLGAGELSAAIAKINSTAEMSDADRQVELQRIMNQFNLDATQMEILQNEAKKDRWSNFFSNLIGGGASIAGAALKLPTPATPAAT
jgi:hypothetical protein